MKQPTLTALVLSAMTMAACTSLDSLKDGVATKAAKITKTAQADKKPYRSTSEILKDAPAADFYRLDQARLVYLTLANDKQVVIELAPQFAKEHAAQIRVLTDGGYWNGLSVYRVQDNYVAQFGSFDIELDKNTKALPKTAKTALPAEFDVSSESVKLAVLPDVDAYSDKLGFVDGFPVAVKDGRAFIVQCYGMVGAARDNAPDSSKGEDLYAIIGQPARNLDRQITVVGRVVHGIEELSSLPRGKGNMGFYDKTQKPVGIKSAVMGDKLPKDKQLDLEAVDVHSQTFADLIDARRHLQSSWHATKTSGGMGVCDVRQTVRVAGQ